MSTENIQANQVLEVPDVGALVEYGLNSFGTAPALYRVSGWIRVAPAPVFKEDDFIAQILFESCQEISDKKGSKARMQTCLREEATHLSLSGICGAIAPIEACKVTGMVNWSDEELSQARMRATKRGAKHEMIF